MCVMIATLFVNLRRRLFGCFCDQLGLGAVAKEAWPFSNSGTYSVFINIFCVCVSTCHAAFTFSFVHGDTSPRKGKKENGHDKSLFAILDLKKNE
jgi:hypothetical protein